MLESGCASNYKASCVSQQPDSETNTSSPSSQSSSAKISLTKIQDDAWVQCENSDCLKWRRISQKVLEQIDKDASWYCHMNPDVACQSCDVPEENYDRVHKKYQKLGFCFVHSTLPLGSLIWAKMVGFCSWPGLVTQDPGGGQYVLKDYYGEAILYHVEFLGEVHSRSWVSSKAVDLYGKGKRPSHNNNKAASKKSVRRGGPKSIAGGGCKSVSRKKYKNYSVEHAVFEADSMLVMSVKDRLSKHVKFVFDPAVKLEQEENGEMPQSAVSHKTTRTKRAKSVTRSVPGTPRKKSKPALPRTPRTPKKINRETDSQNVRDKISDDNKDETEGTLDGKDSIEKRLNCSSSMVGRSKEEKFALDIEMYRRNEQAFEHDVSRFMLRNGQSAPRKPVWQGIQLSLFQVFVAVYEKGGYHQIKSSNGGWSGIYYHITEHGKHGNTVKSFYMRNLLPYEMYVKGMDYKSCFKKKKTDPKPVPSTSTKSVSPDTEMQDKNGDTLKEKEEINKLAEFLNVLEKDDNILDNDAVLPQSDGQRSVSLSFYDDRPSVLKPEEQLIKEANTASEFGQATSPEGAVQLVPVIDYDTHTEESSVSSDDQVLHEMQALQHELQHLHNLMEE